MNGLIFPLWKTMIHTTLVLTLLSLIGCVTTPDSGIYTFEDYQEHRQKIENDLHRHLRTIRDHILTSQESIDQCFAKYPGNKEFPNKQLILMFVIDKKEKIFFDSTSINKRIPHYKDFELCLRVALNRIDFDGVPQFYYPLYVGLQPSKAEIEPYLVNLLGAKYELPKNEVCIGSQSILYRLRKWKDRNFFLDYTKAVQLGKEIKFSCSNEPPQNYLEDEYTDYIAKKYKHKDAKDFWYFNSSGNPKGRFILPTPGRGNP